MAAPDNLAQISPDAAAILQTISERTGISLGEVLTTAARILMMGIEYELSKPASREQVFKQQWSSGVPQTRVNLGEFEEDIRWALSFLLTVHNEAPVERIVLEGRGNRLAVPPPPSAQQSRLWKLR